MTVYKNHSGNSGVTAYESGNDFILIKFIGGDTYRYSNKATGKANVEQMKKLAEAGKGLSTFISQHPDVREKYERKTG